MAAYRHYGCRITDDLVYKGMRALFLENDLLRIGILLDKGADLFQFLHKPTDTDFLWRSPLGLRDPQRTVATCASAAGLEFVQQFGSNHIHMVSGDYVGELRAFCRLVGIPAQLWD